MTPGDLVSWPQGACDIPGIVLETRASLGNCANGVPPSGINPYGSAVLVMLPELGNDPEWFHERELELVK